MKDNKTMRKKAPVLCLGALALVAGLSACGKGNVPDTEETLEVFCCKLGYGSDWCKNILDEFEKEDWVKEKYPNLQVVYDASADRSEVGTRLNAGEGVNTIDLVFSDGLSGYIGTDYAGKEYSVNLTDTVYNTKVPGEDITVYEKLDDDYKRAAMFYSYGQSSFGQELPFNSYNFFWASGMMGIVYNETILKNAFGIDHAPRTTDELTEVLATVTRGNEKYNKGYAIMWSAGGEYSQYLYNVWWGQYEGVDNYYNYYQGVSFDGEDYIERSSDIFKQEGRREALRALIQMISSESGFRYGKGATAEVKATQRYFFRGEGVFMANGDWLAEESKDALAGTTDVFKMMKTPILSAITKKTKTIQNDAKLREVVAKIDENYPTAAAAGLSDVSEEDYKTILEARSVHYALGSGCDALIPSYANGKDVACDFLRYMATDKAQEIYAKSTGGASLPFKYNLKDSPNYDGFTDMQKARIEMMQNSVHGSNVLPQGANFPLVKFGKLGDWSSYACTGGVAIYSRNGSLDPASEDSAEKAFARDLDYWTTNGGAKWSDTLRLAGYTN